MQVVSVKGIERDPNGDIVQIVDRNVRQALSRAHDRQRPVLGAVNRVLGYARPCQLGPTPAALERDNGGIVQFVARKPARPDR